MLKLDDQQLSRVLDAIKLPPAGTSSRLQNARAIVEIVGFLGAGAWAVFTYPWFANQLAAEQLKRKLEKKINVEAHITIRNVGSIDKKHNAYDITYHRDIINLSISKVKVEVCSLEWFVGELANGMQYFRANLPGKAGPITWKSLGIEVHREPEFDDKRLYALLQQNLNTSREVLVLADSERGIGPYNPEERSSDFQTIHVVETPDKWVGFALLIGLRTDEGLEQYYDYRHVHLAMAARSYGGKETPQEIQ